MTDDFNAIARIVVQMKLCINNHEYSCTSKRVTWYKQEF